MGVSVAAMRVCLVMMVAVVMVVFVLASEMVMAIARVQNFHLNEVEDETHDGNDEHDVAFDLRRLEEALCRFEQEPASHDPDG